MKSPSKRFGPRYGRIIREKLDKIEKKQKKSIPSVKAKKQDVSGLFYLDCDKNEHINKRETVLNMQRMYKKQKDKGKNRKNSGNKSEKNKKSAIHENKFTDLNLLNYCFLLRITLKLNTSSRL